VGRGKAGREEGRGGRDGRSEDGRKKRESGFDISFLDEQWKNANWSLGGWQTFVDVQEA
jgi:hypothetical protein